MHAKSKIAPRPTSSAETEKMVFRQRFAEALNRWPGNQVDLADILGCGKETITRWKKGCTKRRRLGLLESFAKLTGIDPYSLWGPRLIIVGDPTNRLDRASMSASPRSDPLDEKIAYLRTTPSAVALRDVVDRLYAEALEQLRATQ